MRQDRSGVALVMALLVLAVMALLVTASVFLAVLQAAGARAAWQGTVATEAARGALALSLDAVEGSPPAISVFGPWPAYGLPFPSHLEPLPDAAERDAAGTDAAGTDAWRLRSVGTIGTATGRAEAYLVVRGDGGGLAWVGSR